MRALRSDLNGGTDEPASRGSIGRLSALLPAGFMVYGVLLTVFGAALPRIITEFRWTYSEAGLVLSGAFVGFLLSTFASGLLVEGTRTKPLYVAALGVAAAAISLFARWPSPLPNLVLSFLIGCAEGVIDVVTNYETIRLDTGGRSTRMNLLHASFSAGAIAGPLAMGGFLATGAAWQLAFPAIGAILLVAACCAMAVGFPFPEKGLHHGARGGLRLLREPAMILLCLAMLFYVGSEVGVTNWVSEYFVRTLGTPLPMAASAVSALWVGILAGRLILSVAWRGRRQETALLLLSVLSLGSLLAFLAVRRYGPAFAVVFAVGVGYSGIYPLIIALAGRIFRSSASVGIVGTASGIGSFAFPFLMAGMAERLGLRAGFLMLALLPLGVIAATAVLLHRRSRRPAFFL